ncbi:MAG TPA: choice-of-anchor R domain-containing protein [Candidatus Doudnabacteria bacterium]|nr:choice-of-anchor R domain-containing protein [Candidatus Doudnabacteria bacterium]
MNQSKQSGNVLLIAIVFMAILLTMSGSLWGYTHLQVKSSHQSVARSQALSLAEAGIDHAVAQLNSNPNYTGETNTSLESGSFVTTVETIDAQTKTITSVGTAIHRNIESTRTVKANVGIDTNQISFRYGVQVGTGGFVMSGGSQINGNVYSNGNISATTGVVITGSAVAANPPALTADQANDSPTPISSCTASTCITYGNATATQDFAQSFSPSIAAPMNNIQFYMRKQGNPGNATVRIVADNAGNPSTTQFMSGTLTASNVTSTFGWITVTMPTTPVLDPSQTYWIVLDGNSNSSNYYVMGANENGYANGTAKVGRYSASWSNTTPANLDGYFRVYLGGGTSMIGGNNYVTGVFVGTSATDEAWANHVQGATVSGPLYCQTSSHTNKACNTSRSNPPPQPMPLSENNILDWKNEAEAGGVTTGNVNVGWAGATIGPRKITGNLTVNGGGTLVVAGTLWIEGNISLSGGGKIVLSPSYGPHSGAIVTDGYVSLAGGSDFAGSGTPGSYPFLITTSACPVAVGCNGNDAISLSGGAGTVALIAQNGNVLINGGSSLRAVTAKQITMTGGATLVYDAGLVSDVFSSGPGGSWTIIKGSYIILD